MFLLAPFLLRRPPKGLRPLRALVPVVGFVLARGVFLFFCRAVPGVSSRPLRPRPRPRSPTRPPPTRVPTRTPSRRSRRARDAHDTPFGAAPSRTSTIFPPPPAFRGARRRTSALYRSTRSTRPAPYPRSPPRAPGGNSSPAPRAATTTTAPSGGHFFPGNPFPGFLRVFLLLSREALAPPPSCVAPPRPSRRLPTVLPRRASPFPSSGSDATLGA